MKDHGKQGQRSSGMADPVKFQVRHLRATGGGNWGIGQIAELENIRRKQLVHQIQNQMILGIPCGHETGKIGEGSSLRK